MEQGSEEWKLARCGSVGASQIADLMARTKSGPSASRANLMAQLLCERLTGAPTEGFTSEAMRWGTETEPQARAAYEFTTDAEVQQVALVPHPSITGSHASPDGLVGDDGLLEIKCPSTATHVETLLGEAVAGKYLLQMQWQMACTGRKWCDFVSFDPRLPADMQLFVQRIPRDDAKIAEIEGEVRTFLGELASKIAALETRFGKQAA